MHTTIGQRPGAETLSEHVQDLDQGADMHRTEGNVRAYQEWSRISAVTRPAVDTLTQILNISRYGSLVC